MKMTFDNDPITFVLPNAEIEYFPVFLAKDIADYYFDLILKNTAWQQDTIKIFGKTYLQPRLTSLIGNPEKSYSYSSITMQPQHWNETLLQIKKKIKSYCDTEFTSVLLNLYRDGNDSNGWHSDNEKELGINPIIASISLGAERSFHLKHNSQKDAKLKLQLTHGSLLIMKGETQHYWKHQIPKTQKTVGTRINLTFRKIY